MLVVTDCPVRYSFLRSSARRRRNCGQLGNKIESHQLIWATRGRGFENAQALQPASPPIVETIASQECIIASRLWAHARELEEDSALGDVLRQGATALKGMALTAAGADALLAPYGDVHDVYHRSKRERHSFEPHYNKALALIAEGRAGLGVILSNLTSAKV